LDKEELVFKLNELINACLIDNGSELIDLICRFEGKNLIIKIFADKLEGKITLGECALLNRKIKQALEEKNLIVVDYILEVSSPGLDRVLKTEKDFAHCLNQEAVFYLNDLVLGKLQWQGIINRVGSQSVFISNLQEVLEIPLIKINKAQLIIQK